MRSFSRHLAPAPPSKNSVAAWICFGMFFVGLAVWIFFKPVVLVFLAGLLGFALFAVALEKRRLRKLSALRTDTICEFARAFDCRAVDPWIIRATHEEVGKWLGGGFPLQAKDRFQEDLRIDEEDLEMIAQDVAARIGYDMTRAEQNPLWGKVRTVRDLIMFFTHQPAAVK